MRRIRYYKPFPYEDYVESLIPESEQILSSFDRYCIMYKTEATLKDALALGISEESLKLLLKCEVGKCFKCEKPTDKEIYALMKDTLFNREVFYKLKSYNPTSEFFDVLKFLLKDLAQFFHIIKSNKSFELLLKYREILNKINLEAIDQNMSKEELTALLDRRYHICSSDFYQYRNRIKNNNYIGDFDTKTGYTKKTNMSFACNLIQRYLYLVMLKDYQSHHYFYRQINEKYSCFILNDITFITYEYDDDIELEYVKNTPENYQFWAAIFMDNFSALSIKIKPKNLDKIDLNSPNTYLVPSRYISEALVLLLKEEGTFSDEELEYFLNRLGIKYNPNSESPLIRVNNNFIVDPRQVELLRNQGTFEYLDKILSKTPEERSKYIKRLVSKYKGELKKQEEQEIARMSNPIYRREVYKRERKDKQYID